VFRKLAEMFPTLCFEINGEEPGMGFTYKATGRDGNFNIEYGEYAPDEDEYETEEEAA
jgi:hypothetical protein